MFCKILVIYSIVHLSYLLFTVAYIAHTNNYLLYTVMYNCTCELFVIYSIVVMKWRLPVKRL